MRAFIVTVGSTPVAVFSTRVKAEALVSLIESNSKARAVVRMTTIDGLDARAREPRDVSEAARAGGDPHCVEASAMFCAMLGTVAGNLALTLGAFGGIYIAGGIVPKLGEMFDRSPFRERFVAKGRFRDYLDQVPTYVVTHPTPAFLGLKAVLDRRG